MSDGNAVMNVEEQESSLLPGHKGGAPETHPNDQETSFEDPSSSQESRNGFSQDDQGKDDGDRHGSEEEDEDDEKKEINEDVDNLPPPLLVVSRSSEAPALISVYSNSMAVQWNPVSTTIESSPGRVFDFYFVYDLEMQMVDMDDDGPVIQEDCWSVQYSGRATYVQVAGLRPGRNYAVRVAYRPVVDDPDVIIDNAPSSAVLIVSTPPTPPSPPSSIILTNRQRHALKVKWTEPDEKGGHPIQLYILECYPPPEDYAWKPEADGMYEIYRGIERSFSLKKLLPGVQYAMRVKAMNIIGESPWSDIFTFATQSSVPSTPDAPVVASATPTSVVLIWAPVASNGADVTGYQVEMDDGEGSDLQFVALTREPQYSASNLLSGFNYKFRIRAENSEGYSQWSQLCCVKTATSPPSKPNPPRRLQATSSAIVIAWSPPEYDGGSPILCYVVEMRPKTNMQDEETPEMVWNIVYKGMELRYTIRGLRPGFAYTVRVQAVNEVGESAFSTEVDVHTAASIPDAPGAPKVSGRHQDSIHIKWLPPEHNGGSEILSYKLENRMVKTIQSNPLIQGAPQSEDVFHTAFEGNELSSHVANLQPGTCYEFRVLAQNKFGQSPWSPLVLGETKPGVPIAPEFESIVPGTEFGSLALHWKRAYGQGAEVTSYVVQMKDVLSKTPPAGVNHEESVSPSEATTSHVSGNVSGNGSMLVTSLPDVQEESSDGQLYQTVFEGSGLCCQIKHLVPNTRYMFRLKACNKVGISPWSRTMLAQTAPAPPGDPEQLKVSQLTNSSVRMMWSCPTKSFGAEVGKYELQYSILSRLSYTGRSWKTAYVGHDLQTEILELHPGQSYCFRARAWNSCGWGRWTEEVIATTLPSTPGKPASPACVPKSSTLIRVAWDPPVETNGAAVVQYELKMWKSSEDADDDKILYKGPDLSFKASNLSPGTTYSFSVRAINAVGPGAFSAPGMATTGLAAPLEPRNVQVMLEDADVGYNATPIGVVAVTWDSPEASDFHAACVAYEIEALCVRQQSGSTSLADPQSKNLNVKQTCKGNACKMRGLNFGEAYRIRVRGIGAHGAGHGRWSAACSVVLPNKEHAGGLDNSKCASIAGEENDIVVKKTKDTMLENTSGKLKNLKEGTEGKRIGSGPSKSHAISKMAVAKPRPKTHGTVIARLFGISDKALLKIFLLFVFILTIVFLVVLEPEQEVAYWEEDENYVNY